MPTVAIVPADLFRDAQSTNRTYSMIAQVVCVIQSIGFNELNRNQQHFVCSYKQRLRGTNLTLSGWMTQNARPPKAKLPQFF